MQKYVFITTDPVFKNRKLFSYLRYPSWYVITTENIDEQKFRVLGIISSMSPITPNKTPLTHEAVRLFSTITEFRIGIPGWIYYTYNTLKELQIAHL